MLDIMATFDDRVTTPARLFVQKLVQTNNE